MLQNLDVTNDTEYDYILSINVATKIFGHAQARAAISNGANKLFDQIAVGLNNAVVAKKNDMFNEYVQLGRLTAIILTYLLLVMPSMVMMFKKTNHLTSSLLAGNFQSPSVVHYLEPIFLMIYLYLPTAQKSVVTNLPTVYMPSQC